MSAGVLDIIIDQGADFFMSVTVKDVTSVGPPIVSAVRDLTNYTARMMIRARYSDATPVISLVMAAGITIPAPTTGVVVVQVANALSSAVTVTKGVYDLELVHATTGFVERLIQGRVTFRPEATR